MARPQPGPVSPNASGTLACAVVLGGITALAVVLWLQFSGAVQPCSLCIYQRLADLLMLLFAIPLCWRRAQGRLRAILTLGAGLGALVGMGLAGWQWHLGDSINAQPHLCAAIQLLPAASFAPSSFSEPLAEALSGKGSCAVAGQHLLWGWPVTHWSVAFFACCTLLLMGIYGLDRYRQPR